MLNEEKREEKVTEDTGHEARDSNRTYVVQTTVDGGRKYMRGLE